MGVHIPFNDLFRVFIILMINIQLLSFLAMVVVFALAAKMMLFPSQAKPNSQDKEEIKGSSKVGGSQRIDSNEQMRNTTDRISQSEVMNRKGNEEGNKVAEKQLNQKTQVPTGQLSIPKTASISEGQGAQIQLKESDKLVLSSSDSGETDRHRKQDNFQQCKSSASVSHKRPIKQSPISSKLERIKQQVSSEHGSYEQTHKTRHFKKLKAIKEHYKAIIGELQDKLRHYEGEEDPQAAEQTIIFSESDSVLNSTQGELQLKVEEVQCLKEELQLHEEALENILDEGNALKDQIEELQSENKRLHDIVTEKGSVIDKTPQKEQIPSQKAPNPITSAIFTPNQPRVQRTGQSRSAIEAMYSSGTIQARDLFRQNISAIAAMSIIQGTKGVGLLGQCHFLNGISKNYIISQTKKLLKKPLAETQMLIEAGQDTQVGLGMKLGVLFERGPILLIMKLANGRSMAALAYGAIGAVWDVSKRRMLGKMGCFEEEGSAVWGRGEFELALSTLSVRSSSGYWQGSTHWMRLQALQIFLVTLGQ